MRRRKQEKTNYLLIALIIFTSSIILGSIYSNLIKKNDFQSLVNYINDYIKMMKSLNASSPLVFFETFFKYAKYIIIILVLSASKYKYLTYIVFIIKGFSIGFTNSILLMTLGFKGLVVSSSLHAIQNTIAISLYLFFAYFCFNYFTNKKKNKNEIYIATLFSLSIVIVISLIEILLSPILFNLIAI